MKFFSVLFLFFSSFCFSIEKYFATTCDTEHYNWLILQIESLFQYNQEIVEVAVFDLGLTQKQKAFLNHLTKVVVLDLEETNSQLKKEFQVRQNGRIARGWYSWKPIAIKQALERYPYVLYMDAGIRAKAPLDRIFEHIVQNDYLLFSAGHNLKEFTTQYVKNYFQLDPGFLTNCSISAGLQGLTKAMLKEYILPVYEFSKNIHLFEDDGSCAKGFGYARHDQIIFSILVHQNQYRVHHTEDSLLIDGEEVPFQASFFWKFKPT